MELPSNVTPIWEGTITLTLPRDVLWLEPPAEDIDITASCLLFLSIWRNEMLERHPRTKVAFRLVAPDNTHTMRFSITDNHPHHDQVSYDANQLLVAVAQRPANWQAKKGSPAAQRMARLFEEQTKEWQSQGARDGV